MRRLAVIFLTLVGIAFLAALTGILLATGGRRLGGGPVVLVWRVDRPILEQAAEPFLFGGAAADSMTVLYPAFRAARADRQVKGMAVYIRSTQFGLGKAQELRRQLLAMRQAGKFVECYAESVGEGSNGTLAYYLATACDRIEMAPSGDVNLLGLYAEGIFLKGSLAKLKVDPQFHHIGLYKSFAETYTESHWTAPAAEAINAVLDSSYDQIVTAITLARKIPAGTVRALVNGAPYTAPEAVRKRLIDSLGYPEDFRARVTRRAAAVPGWCGSRTTGRTGCLPGAPAGVSPSSSPRARSYAAGVGRHPGAPRPSWVRTTWPTCCASWRGTTPWRRSYCGSTAPVARPSPPTSSSTRCNSSPAASRSWPRCPTSPPPAATTSPPAPARSSPSRPP